MTQNLNKKSAQLLRFSGVFLVLTLVLLSVPKSLIVQGHNSVITQTNSTASYVHLQTPSAITVSAAVGFSGVISANTNQANVLFSDASNLLSENIGVVQNTFKFDNTERSATLTTNSLNAYSSALQFATAYSAIFNLGKTTQNIFSYQLSSDAPILTFSLPAVNSFTSKIILQLVFAATIALYLIPRKEKFFSQEFQIIGVMRC